MRRYSARMERTSESLRTPGRPRNEGLRERLIHSARRLFIEQGPGVSLDKIAAAAGTTKVTLYSHFASKEALLEGVLEAVIDQTVEAMPIDADPHDPRAVLQLVAERYLVMVTDQDTAVSALLLFQAAATAPSLVRRFVERGPQGLSDRLAAYLSIVPGLQLSAPDIAAEQFIGMIRGLEQARAMLRLTPARREAARQSYLANCVDVFLRGHGYTEPQ